MNTYKVKIIYKFELDKFTQPLSFVADSELSIENFLENVFAWFNHGSQEESALFLASGRHSLSVDDVVEVNGKQYMCANVGWIPLTKEGVASI